MFIYGFSIFSVASHVGLPVMAVIVFAETGCGIPVAPGEIAVVSAGINASNGQYSVVAVIIVAAAAAIIGDNVGYTIGLFGGRRLLERPGPFLRQRTKALKLADPFFEKHGSKAVFYGRWLPFLRVFASWFAGGTRMPWRTFVIWNAAGGITWAISISVLGYTLGSTAKTVVNDIGVYGLILMVISAGIAYVLHKRHQRQVLTELGGEGTPPAPTQATAAAPIPAPAQATVLRPRPAPDEATKARPQPAFRDQPPTAPPTV